MGLDWDALVLRPAERIFGAGVSYRREPAEAFTLADAVFDRAHLVVEFADGAPVSTRRPLLSVRLSAFPAGFAPEQGDVVFADGGRWVVIDVQPDGKGGCKLPLSAYQEAP